LQHLFSFTLIVLLSAVAVSAQTAGDLKPGSERNEAEYAAHLKDHGVSDKKKAKLKEEAGLRAPGVVRLGPSRTFLRTGLSTDDVVKFLGQPSSVSETQEGSARLTIYIFQRGEGRVIVAEFTNGALIRSRTEIRQDLTTRCEEAR
jgi:hypothetical protein